MAPRTAFPFEHRLDGAAPMNSGWENVRETGVARIRSTDSAAAEIDILKEDGSALTVPASTHFRGLSFRVIGEGLTLSANGVLKVAAAAETDATSASAIAAVTTAAAATSIPTGSAGTSVIQYAGVANGSASTLKLFGTDAAATGTARNITSPGGNSLVVVELFYVRRQGAIAESDVTLSKTDKELITRVIEPVA